MKTSMGVAFAFGAMLVAAPVTGQSPMTVREFNQIAASTPRNATALLRPSVRRAQAAMNGGFEAARAEEARARTAGRAPPFCIPGTTNISPNDVMTRMRAVPAAQQGQTVSAAIRGWMVERFPCR